ncbi:polysaccharide deacetylase family protein [Leptolinea tardivitalis]|uniref:NodB homology domain-containing protein n=1 Tax=Leptolinea tardivitalis TaxID=229920 RepID=A0A0P6X2U2_9CHLR|nr:polysaccharide deacetylase family protein [Leptolinea tardivitalis]KPL74015.1 hypothetical protein ADM99_01915 [Leptolinea tardivitalis]GAP22653.1 predicted xylanase [Leptolinea tardivitalis]
MAFYNVSARWNNYLFTSGLSRLARPFAPYMGALLMFHRVVVPDGLPRIRLNQTYEVTPDHLRTVIAFYRQREFDFISLDDMIERLQKKEKSPRFVCFTFDDGYADTLTTAYPILKEEGIPFCIYLTTDFPDRKARFWWNILEDTLLSRPEIHFSLDGKEHTIICNSLEEKETAFQSICQIVLKAGCGVSAAWRAVFEPLSIDVESATQKLALSWEQINTLGHDPLVTIGAHTCSHPPLAGLTEQEAQDEMQNSRQIIWEKTGLRAEHFAYPYGSPLEVTDREIKLASRLGFKTAATTNQGNVYAYHRNRLLQLPRININESEGLQTLTLAADGCIAQTIRRF